MKTLLLLASLATAGTAAIAPFSPQTPDTAAPVPAVCTPEPSVGFAQLPSDQWKMVMSDDQAELAAVVAGMGDDLPPLFLFKAPCPELVHVVNFTKCTLYLRFFFDCDGDGEVDGWDEYFVQPPDEDGNPWEYFHEPNEDCKILYWGVFDILPWGGCWPVPFTHPDYPCSMGFF